MQIKRMFLILLSMALLLVILGCGGENRRTNRTLNGSAVDVMRETFAYGSTVKHIKRLEKDVMEPAVDAYTSFTKEKAALYKQKKYHEHAFKEMPQIKDKYIPALKEAQRKLAAEPTIKITDGYLYYSRLYVVRALERLECAAKVAECKDTKEAAKLRSRGDFLERRLIWEAKFGYDNAKSILLNKGASYNMNENTYKLIAKYSKKGVSYETVMHWFRMPGEFLPVIKTNENGKTVVHQPVIWVDGDRFVYVDFVNGKSVSWSEGKSSGFRNRS